MLYPKIQTIYKRDTKTHKVIEGDYSTLELQYLADSQWQFTEKIHGINVRIVWDGVGICFTGRNGYTPIPPFLRVVLEAKYTQEKFSELYPATPMIIFGEGYGARLQKGGGRYLPDSVDFIMFDVYVPDTEHLMGGWWLQWHNVCDIADKLDTVVVPIVGSGILIDACNIVKKGAKSQWGDFIAEGVVAKPYMDFFTRKGERVIAKIKHKDFRM